MRVSDVDILIAPGWMDSGPDHWQSRWEKKLSTARRVGMPDFNRPVCSAWKGALVDAVGACARPVFLVAHSLGVTTVAHAAALFPKDKVVGAWLAAPPDLDAEAALCALKNEGGDDVALPEGFAPTPNDPLPFPALVIASSDDPCCAYDRAARMAKDWGATLVHAGDAGHINAASGYGPWPDGVLRLAAFLRSIGAGA